MINVGNLIEGLKIAKLLVLFKIARAGLLNKNETFCQKCQI